MATGGAEGDGRRDADGAAPQPGRSRQPGRKQQPRKSQQPRKTQKAQKAQKTQKAQKAQPKTPSARRRRDRRLRQVDEFSAGGLVLDLAGDIPRGALIARTDRHGRLLWSLPKGHIEAGETAEQAAVREVEEETGIAGTILGELGTIDFWFVAEGRRIHKTVQHYLCGRSVASSPTPTSR